MPIIPPSSSAPYDYVYQVLNSARGRLNDAMPTLYPVSGKVLSLESSATQQLVINAWHKLQDKLADRGYSRLNAEVIITGFPPCSSPDPAAQVWISWTGCFDGQNFFTSPALPSDFTHPLRMWERWSGQNALFVEMGKWLDGLPSCPRNNNMQQIWEWRGDAIYMPGSLQTEDLRFRYVKYLADFLDVGNTQWFNQQVPIMRSSDSLSWYMCYEVASSRGTSTDMALAEIFKRNAEDALNHVFNLDVRADQRVNIRRQPRSGRGQGGGRMGYGIYG